MNISIIGTGAYGIALAMTAIKKNQVTMWTKFEDEYHMLVDYRKNIKSLPNTVIPSEIEITTSLKECVQNTDLIILAIPSITYHEVCQELKPYVKNNQIICIASKGITPNDEFLSDVVGQYLTNDIVILSGPSFASDLIEEKPIGLTMASTENKNIKLIEDALSHQYLCFDYTDDIIGVQMCGIIKNVFAIGSGILEGLNCPESTKAAYITKCIKEIKSFLPIVQGEKDTVSCYCGIGDLILTCNSTKSRNFSYGKLVGSKKTKEEIELFKDNYLVEGFTALKGIYQIFKEKNYSSKIIEMMFQILYGNQSPEILLTFIHTKSK